MLRLSSRSSGSPKKVARGKQPHDAVRHACEYQQPLLVLRQGEKRADGEQGRPD